MESQGQRPQRRRGRSPGFYRELIGPRHDPLSPLGRRRGLPDKRQFSPPEQFGGATRRQVATSRLLPYIQTLRHSRFFDKFGKTFNIMYQETTRDTHTQMPAISIAKSQVPRRWTPAI